MAWAFPAALAAQDGGADDTYTDIDDLFDLPAEDGGDDETSTDEDGGAGEEAADDEEDAEDTAPLEPETLDIDALTTSPTKVTGSVSASAGVNLGYNEWPDSAAAEERTDRDLLEVAAGYTLKTSVAVDSRPQPYLRYRAKLSSSLGTTNLRMSTPSFDEIFVDYTVRDTVFLRAGKFGMGWGRARLFTSPGNLVSRVSGGAALRGSSALGLGSVTAVLYTLPAWIELYEDQGDPRSFGGALQLEQSVGIFTAELAGHYQEDEHPETAATVTMGLGNLTLAGEARYRIDRDAPGPPSTDANKAEAVGNFFWENSARSWTFWGEYSFDEARRDKEVGDDDVRRDGMHLVGLAMKAPSLGGGEWRPQLTWRHAVGDLSGQVIAGTSGTVAPNLKLSFGMPVFYGKPGSYYRGVAETRDLDAEDSTLTDQETDLLRISGQDVISVTFGLGISFSF